MAVKRIPRQASRIKNEKRYDDPKKARRFKKRLPKGECSDCGKKGPLLLWENESYDWDPDKDQDPICYDCSFAHLRSLRPKPRRVPRRVPKRVPKRVR